MNSLKQMWRKVRLRHEDDLGASLVEYALLLALIAVVCIGAISFFGLATSSKYSKYNRCVGIAGTNTVDTSCR